MLARPRSAHPRLRLGRRGAACVLALGAALLSPWGGSVTLAEPAVAPFVIVVSSKNPLDSADRDFLKEAFLKKKGRWDDGEVIRPVDQPAASAVRRDFSQSVLRRSVTAVRTYWQQRIFSGRDLPPPELGSDQAVVSYVRGNRGGIGYVSRTAALDGVKVVAIK